MGPGNIGAHLFLIGKYQVTISGWVLGSDLGSEWRVVTFGALAKRISGH